MNIRPLLPAALAAILVNAAQAADTPGVDPAAVAATRAAAPDRLAVARQAIEARDWNRAIAELSAAAREQPQSADVHNLLGYSWRKRSDPDVTKAFSHYYTALRIDPRHRGAHEYIGQAYLMEKRPAEAERHLLELEKICGKGCPEYQDLAKAIAEFKAGR